MGVIYHAAITPLAIFHSINKSVKFVKYYLIGCPRSEIEGTNAVFLPSECRIKEMSML